MSKLQEEVDMLRSIPMLSTMPANKLKLLAFASDRVSYNKGDVLFNQGDEADSAYIVISGGADVLVSSDGKAKPSKVAELGTNAFIGDMAILCDMPRTASVKASSQLDTLRIKKEHMMDMVNDSPELAMAVLRELVQRLTKTTHDLSEAREEVAKLKAS